MNKNMCYIFAAGDIYTNAVEIPESALVIAADGGLKHAEALGIKPDVILGDFDSYDLGNVSGECTVFPREKDYTDMYLAIEHGYNSGLRKFEIFGGLGGKRIEHTIANLQLLEYFSKRNCEITLHGDGELITALSGDGKDRISKAFSADYRGYISLFAVGGNIKGLTVSGLKYELDNAVLTPEFPLGISNEFCGNAAEISFLSGTLVLVFENKL